MSPRAKVGATKLTLLQSDSPLSVAYFVVTFLCTASAWTRRAALLAMDALALVESRLRKRAIVPLSIGIAYCAALVAAASISDASWRAGAVIVPELLRGAVRCGLAP